MDGANIAKPGTRPWTTAIALTFLVFFGCKAEDPILIGFLAGTSGRVADLGISGRDAAQLAIEQCNQSGGVSGRKVRLIVKDDQHDSEVARQATQELISKGVVAIIGPMTSDMALAVTPIANNGKLLLLSPTATTESLSEKNDYFFRVASTTRNFASRGADFLIKSGRMHRVATAYDLNNRSFSEKWVENFTNEFTELGGRIVATVGIDALGNRNFFDFAKELLAAQPDGVVIVANSMDSALLCQQIRKLDAKVEIALSDWGATERLLDLGGKAVEGVIVIQAFDRSNQSPRYQDFRKSFMERYHQEPGFPGVNTYDAVQVLLTALRAQKKGQSLPETILSINQFEGLQSNFCFSRFGDAQRPQTSISIVRDRQFMVLE
ncbi:MAG: ABC transporter substrate-binding protein [Deltaproteobacteria bacterium]|nr:ABC transporter substrate-binding protein [Deltaproteobacteria bacterium]